MSARSEKCRLQRGRITPVLIQRIIPPPAFGVGRLAEDDGEPAVLVIPAAEKIEGRAAPVCAGVRLQRGAQPGAGIVGGEGLPGKAGQFLI